MLSGGNLIELATAAAQGGGVAGAAYFVSRSVGPILKFLGERSDAKAQRIADREKRLDQRYDARMEHLERAEIALSREVSRLSELLEKLVGEFRKVDPTNPILLEVARSLRAAIPLEPFLPADMEAKLGEMR